MKKNKNHLIQFIALPRTIEGQKEKAARYTKELEKLAPFYFEDRNLHLKWLEQYTNIDVAFYLRFCRLWRPLSRFQPQTLAKILAAFPEQEDQATIWPNLMEEAGFRGKDHKPHWWWLDRDIEMLGGMPESDPKTEQLLLDFLKSLDSIPPHIATAIVCGIEAPGVTISNMFTTMVQKIGRSDMLKKKGSFYVWVHTRVEFSHQVYSAGNMFLWMNDKERQKKYGYKSADVVAAYRATMEFWKKFFDMLFAELGYHE